MGFISEFINWTSCCISELSIGAYFEEKEETWDSNYEMCAPRKKIFRIEYWMTRTTVLSVLDFPIYVRK